MAQKPLSVLSDTSDIGTLEFLLKLLYGQPRDDLARELAGRFGNVAGVFHAGTEALCEVEGVTERVASFFTFAGALERTALLREAVESPIDSQRAAIDFCRAYFYNKIAPFSMSIFLDKNKKLITVRPFSADPVREIVSDACELCAAYVLPVKHVYEPLPRYAVCPEWFTELSCPLDLIGAVVPDMFVVTDDHFFSLRDAQWSGEGFKPMDRAAPVPFGKRSILPTPKY